MTRSFLHSNSYVFFYRMTRKEKQQKTELNFPIYQGRLYEKDPLLKSLPILNHGSQNTIYFRTSHNNLAQPENCTLQESKLFKGENTWFKVPNT